MSSVFLNQPGSMGGQSLIGTSQPKDEDFLAANIPQNDQQNGVRSTNASVDNSTANPMISAASLNCANPNAGSGAVPTGSPQFVSNTALPSIVAGAQTKESVTQSPPSTTKPTLAALLSTPQPTESTNKPSSLVIGIAEVVKPQMPDFDPSRNRFGVDEFPEQEDEPIEDTYSILAQTFLIVSVIIAAKICLREFIPWKGEIELAEISLVFTGLFFLLGIMFSNVNADLKEAEKMPMDVVSSLDQLEDSFILASSKISDKVDLSEMQSLLLAFAISWRDMMLKDNGITYGDTLHCLSDIVVLVRDWDKKGAANTAPIVVVIDKVRRVVSRGTVVQRTEVLPAARALLNFFVFMSCVLLFLASYKTLVALSMVISCVMTVCIFMARIIQAMDDPFNIRPPLGIQRWIYGHMAAVQVFPLTEYITRMERRKIKSDEAARLRLQTMAGVMLPK